MFTILATYCAAGAIVGIGGGSLSVPFMLRCNVAVHHAIGISAAVGQPNACGDDG